MLLAKGNLLNYLVLKNVLHNGALLSLLVLAEPTLLRNVLMLDLKDGVPFDTMVF